MAGHLLSTVNPEAAEAIGNENPGSLPPVGTLVRYYPRPGEGRGGRRVFSMLVQEHLADGRIAGTAIFDANDFRDVQGIWQRTDAQQFPSWDWIEQAHNRPAEAADAITPPTARVMSEKIASLTSEVANLQAAVSKAFSRIQELQANLTELANLSSEVAKLQLATHPPVVAAGADFDERLLRLESDMGYLDMPKPKKK